MGVVRGDCRDPCGRATLRLPSVSGLQTHVSRPSKAQSLRTKLTGVNLLSVQYKKGVSRGVKIGFGPTRGFGRIHIYILVHLFSCIPRLRPVYAVDVLHTKLSSVTVRVGVK